ncbi:MAG: transposase [Nitrospirae bacterium CG2_30_70_394]|nr:transposase [Deltaproteobacteria bacterium]NCP97191.1 transposase [Deltaproteobacteria bacterium]OIP65981.1 MAG: transposase [Nitrospirae bacterium CG2_30_70_394]HBB41596.1 transposase [Pseudomonadota bacterium]
MARQPRLHLPGGVYHVMLRGNGGREIFSAEEDYRYLYGLLAEGVGRFGYRVHAFCCMSNHLHLAVQTGEETLSRGLQNVAFRYARRVNRREERIGHLFQGRYKAILVDRDSYLLELVRYIHLNPVRAGLVAEPEAYPWSGHRAYLGKDALPWLTTDWILGQFGGRLGVARRRYQEFVHQGVGEGHRDDFHGGGDDTRLLGDDEFSKEALGAEYSPLAARVSLDDLVTVVCDEWGLPEGALAIAGQGRRVSDVRAAVGWLARELGCATLAEVGRRTNRTGSSVTSAVQRLSARVAQDRDLSERLERLRDRLSAKFATLHA